MKNKTKNEAAAKKQQQQQRKKPTKSFEDYRAEVIEERRQQKLQRRKPPKCAAGTVVAESDLWAALQSMRMGVRGPESSYEPSIVFVPTDDGRSDAGTTSRLGDVDDDDHCTVTTAFGGRDNDLRWEDESESDPYRRSLMRQSSTNRIWDLKYPEEGQGNPRPVEAVVVPSTPSHLHKLRTDYIMARGNKPPRPHSAMAKSVSAPALVAGASSGSGMQAVRKRRPQSAVMSSRGGGGGGGTGTLRRMNSSRGGSSGGGKAASGSLRRPSSASSIRDAYRQVSTEVRNSPTKSRLRRVRRPPAVRLGFQSTVSGNGWSGIALDSVPYGHTLVSRQPGVDELQHAWTCGV
jgi:hypothetical protein